VIQRGSIRAKWRYDVKRGSAKGASDDGLGFGSNTVKFECKSNQVIISGSKKLDAAHGRAGSLSNLKTFDGSRRHLYTLAFIRTA
jgi:hypothetical protein